MVVDRFFSVWFGLLGSFVVLDDDGQEVDLGPPQRRELLAFLLSKPNRPVSVDSIIEALWPGEDQPQAAKTSVQAHVSRLRRILGRDRITTRPPGYLVRVAPDAFDVLDFSQSVADGKRLSQEGFTDAAFEQYSKAVALWRDEPFLDYVYADWAQLTIGNLKATRKAALQQRFELALRLGLHAEMIPELETESNGSPDDEQLARLLAVALYRSGRQADALDRLNSLRTYLIDEMGLDPSSETEELETAILQQDETLELQPHTVAASRPLRTPTVTQPISEAQMKQEGGEQASQPVEERPTGFDSLPTQVTSFVGRELELSDLLRVADRERLVTIVGPGGVGKTRLAVRAAEKGMDRYPDGIWFVELAPTAEPRLVGWTLASTLGLEQPEAETLDLALARFLREKRGLLVFDNCEHLIEDVAALAQYLIRECPRLKVVATSREPLAIHGEMVYRLGGLRIPDVYAAPNKIENADAMRLLVERTHTLGRDIRVDASNASALARICQIVDGLPLGLELVAARLQVMSPSEAVDQLDHQLRFLSSNRRGVPDRHRTLRATIDWSYQLLDDGEREVLRRLSVFRGGFDLDAVSAMYSEVPGDDHPVEMLSHLVAKSLVIARFEEGGTRYNLSEPVRSYASEKLAGTEREAVRRGHADFFLGMAKEADMQLTGSDQHQWIRRLEQERENFRASREFMREYGLWSEALELAIPLGWFHLMRGYLEEGLQWLEETLDQDQSSSLGLRAEALTMVGILAGQQGSAEKARRHFEDALRIRRSLGDRSGSAANLINLALIAEQSSDLGTQRKHLREALSLLRAIDQPSERDRERLWSCLNTLAGLEFTFGRAEQAEQLAREVVRQSPNDWVLCRSLGLISQAAAAQNRLQDASHVVERAIDIATELGDRPVLAQLSRTQGDILAAQGKYDQADQALEDALDFSRELGDDYNLAESLLVAGRIAAISGEDSAAAARLGESLKLTSVQGNKLREAECYDAIALLVADDDPRTATLLLGAAQVIRQSLDVPPPRLHQSHLEKIRNRCHRQLGDEVFEALLSQAHRDFSHITNIIPRVLERPAD